LPETQLAEAVADNSLDHEITAAQIESPDVVGNAAPAVVEEAGVQHNEAPDHIDAAPAIAQVESGAAVDAESRTVDIPLVDSSDPTGDDKATEELLVEVWRPRPPNRQHRRPAPSEKNVRANAKEAGEGNRRSGTNESAPWRARTRRHGPSPQPAADAAKPQVEDGGRFQSGRRARQFDPVNKIEGAEGQHFGKRHARSADERKQDGRRHETPPAPAPRREAPVNLNSPFAKLLALKTQLETKGKG
jgi:ATP-dependent RNA helicase SUPV3L1/SUV3